MSAERSTPRLACARLVVEAGGRPVVHGVDLAVDPGEVLALLGRNGSGKSTLLAGLAGLAERTRGEVRLDGVRIDRRPPERRLRAGLGLAPQGRRPFASLTVAETLRIAHRRRRPWLDPAGVGRLLPLLAERADERVGRLSGGQQQLVNVGRLLVGNPAAALLDEPFEGLDPEHVGLVAAAVRRLRAAGAAVVLVEQRLAEALALADRVAVVDRGELVSPPQPADRLGAGDLRAALGLVAGGGRG